MSSASSRSASAAACMRAARRSRRSATRRWWTKLFSDDRRPLQGARGRLLPACCAPASATAMPPTMAVIELVDRDPAAKGLDSGPKPEAVEDDATEN